jgi:hypothetical protein
MAKLLKTCLSNGPNRPTSSMRPTFTWISFLHTRSFSLMANQWVVSLGR